MSYDPATSLYKLIDCRFTPPQPTPEELREKIETAVLHCIEYKAKAIEAAYKFNKEREDGP